MVTGGPALTGANMNEKRLHFIREFDWIRKGLMFEPRGHDLMSGSILYPAQDPANDAAVLFIETSGCLPMCGHGTIGTVTIAVTEGLIRPRNPGTLRLETPAGIVSVRYIQNHGRVESVRLTNVPSFLHSESLELDCPGLGRLQMDVSYGGNFYAIIDQQENFRGLEHYGTDDLVRWGRAIRRELNDRYIFIHPLDPFIRSCTHVLWAGAPMNTGSTARNAVLYGEKAIDRSPCGTGTSARMAQWVQKGWLKKGETFIHESIIGSQFTGRVEELVQVGPYPGIIPSVEGWARIYGYNTITIDEDDPYAQGFQVV